jgi:hypothetical protein
VTARAHALSAALVATALAFARAAAADGVAACPMRPGDRLCVAIADTFSASPAGDEVSTLHFAPQLAAGVRLARSFTATLDLAAATTSFEVYDEPRRHTRRIGNPILGIHFAPWENERSSLRVGLAFGPPLVTVPGTIPSNVAAEYGDEVSLEARGFSGYWLWARNAIPIALLLRSEAQLASHLSLDAGLEPGLLVSVNSSPSHAALAAHAAVAYRIGPLAPGLRLQALVRSTPLAEGDFAQLALAPFTRLDVGHGFLRAELDLNLDGPYGLAGRAGATVWGATLEAGARF